MPGTVSVSASGNQDIDGILYDRKWAVSSFTFSFPTSASFYQAGSAPNGETASNFDVLNATQQNFVRNYVLSQFAAVANVTFSELTETSSVHADLRFAQSDVPNTAWAYYPASQGYGGDSWYNNSSGNYDNPVVGNYAGHTFLHEVGHAFGLVHGHDSVDNPFGALPSAHDSVEYSIMTYRTYVGGPLNGYTYGSASAPQTLMQNDIAALQYLYGANYNTQSGNTTYTWSSTTGRMSIDGVQQAATAGNKIFMTLWDGNGNDTYDFSNYTTNLSVNLQPGAWTTVSSTQVANLGSGHFAAGNIANALLYQGDTRSLIENAIGGTGNDTLVGNSAANRLDGRRGNDTLTGGIGNDTFVYGSNYGADFITDFIAGNSSGDKIDLERTWNNVVFASHELCDPIRQQHPVQLRRFEHPDAGQCHSRKPERRGLHPSAGGESAEWRQRHRFLPRPDLPVLVAVRRQRSRQRSVDLLRSRRHVRRRAFHDQRRRAGREAVGAGHPGTAQPDHLHRRFERF